MARPEHFSVQVSINIVVEHAAGSDHQGYAEERRHEKSAINLPFGSKQKAGGRGDQIAANDPRFGDERIVLD